MKTHHLCISDFVLGNNKLKLCEIFTGRKKNYESKLHIDFKLIVITLVTLSVIISTCDGLNEAGDTKSGSLDNTKKNNVILPEFEVRVFRRNLTTGFLQVENSIEQNVSFLGLEDENDSPPSRAFSILADLNQRYDIACVAPYLTDMEINFPITRTDKLFRFRLVSDPFDRRTFIYRSLFYFFTKVGTTGTITCRSIENKNVFTSIHIFTQAGKPFIDSGKLKLHTSKILNDDPNNFHLQRTQRETGMHTVIPCPTNYPWITPQLTKRNFGNDSNETFTQVIPANYDPKVGFRLVVADLQNNDEGEYKCVTHEPQNDEVVVKYISISSGVADDDDSSLNGTPHVFFPSNNGKIFCIDENNLPTEKRIAAILCDSQPDCDLHKSCYEDIDNCTAVHLKGEECSAGSCALIDESHQSGAVICESGSSKLVEYYFTGFDKRRYKISEENISTRALIYMDRVNPVLFTDQSTFFFCEAISFIFTPYIQFAAVMENGTKVALVEGESYVQASPEEMDSKLSRGTVQKGILMNVTEDMREIICMVPWFNSSEWLTTSTKFLTKKPLPASINKVYNHKIFYIGEHERTLTCSSEGEPTPTFQWFYDDMKIDDGHPSYSISDALDGKSTLRFPIITHNITGNYICLASNRLGNDSFVFGVFTKESGLTPAEIVGAVVGCGMLLGIITFGFIVIWKKYLTTKKKLRKLTSMELEEFENGNPEALSLEGDLHEHAQFLPFDKNYEIRDPDLVIDKKGVLGKGSYGVVLRGRYLGDPVAVKTTLPSADVSYFKALMAEVKIMAYIGHHKNIVTFVGAVTSNMRERMLYIVVELSPFGNLEAYLKSHRSTFVNFIEDNGVVESENNRCTYTNVLKRVSSLDLINWCSHIASGMEYLASKKVIHGDLATRNVLLYPGDVAKITDFGLSRQLYEHTNYVKKQQAPLPWRWMALESLRDFEFSTQSDVWAFGVTAWEIFSLAETPYPGYSFGLDLIDKLEQGMRMKKPKYASDEIFEKILSCWNPTPQNRPSFESHREFFSSMWYKYSDSAKTFSSGSFGNGRNGVCLFVMERD